MNWVYCDENGRESSSRQMKIFRLDSRGWYEGRFLLQEENERKLIKARVQRRSQNIKTHQEEE